ncbi:hypothetical protein QVM88_15480 [Providencia stuartii]|nr:hypothetical protein [Providencia stuartii]MDN0007720.1 hypothetical protein [Providencia stuartii]
MQSPPDLLTPLSKIIGYSESESQSQSKWFWGFKNTLIENVTTIKLYDWSQISQ